MSINEYKIVVGDNAAALSERVTEALKAGWFPYGNPYIGNNRHNQAMIKEGPINPPVRGITQ